MVVARRTAEGFKEERRYELGGSATWTLPVLLPMACWFATPPASFVSRGRPQAREELIDRREHGQLIAHEG
jgi:hypothetical protein